MRNDLYELDQFVGLTLNEDWSDEYDDPYEAAEPWFTETSDDRLRELILEIDDFFRNVPGEKDRRAFFPTYGAFPETGDAFDRWLLAARRRAEQAVAGIHSDPLAVPADGGGLPERGEPIWNYLYELSQLVDRRLNFNWRERHDDPYEAAEGWFMTLPAERLHDLVLEIDDLLRKVPDETERRSLFNTYGAFPRTGDAFDRWLLAVRRRAEQAIVGDHSQPLVPPATPDAPVPPA